MSSLLGGLFYATINFIAEGILLASRFKQATDFGNVLAKPRITYISAIWGISLFVIALTISWLYAITINHESRSLKKALLIGISVGFCTAFPMNISTVSWMPADPTSSYFVMAYLCVGAVGSSVIAGIVYQE